MFLQPSHLEPFPAPLSLTLSTSEEVDALEENASPSAPRKGRKDAQLALNAKPSHQKAFKKQNLNPKPLNPKPLALRSYGRMRVHVRALGDSNALTSVAWWA